MQLNHQKSPLETILLLLAGFALIATIILMF